MMKHFGHCLAQQAALHVLGIIAAVSLEFTEF